MSQIVIDSQIKNGNLNLKDIPLKDGTEVKVIVIPKVDLSKLSFKKTQKLLQGLDTSLSEEIIAERKGK